MDRLGKSIEWTQNRFTKIRIQFRRLRRKVTESLWLKGLLVTAILGALWLRALWQPIVLNLREHSFSVLLTLLTIVLFVAFVKFKVKRLWYSALTVPIALVLIFAFTGANEYVALYLRYQNIDIVELDELPRTEMVTPQPLSTALVLARDKITETEDVSFPDRVMDDGGISLSIEVSPSYRIRKLFGSVREVFLVSATGSSISFDHRERVHFASGEKLALWNNVYAVSRRSFGIQRFFGYYPTDMRYLRNDEGEIVQVVSLARWQGIFFPSIEFGGVQVIEQQQNQPLWRRLLRPVLGEGTWIRPEEIQEHAYLRGQNLMPLDVSRYIASTFRYQRGFHGPMPGLGHHGDVRIPDLAEDLNRQPFVQHFTEVGVGGPLNASGRDGLFAYFGMEPWHPDRRGLALSIFIPGDGDENVYVYNHAARQDSLTGTTAIGAWIVDSRKEYDWSRSHPIEHRPYIRDIAGERRLFFLTTIAVLDERGNVTGSNPEIVITDVEYNTPIWVDVMEGPDGWDQTILETLGSSYEQ